MMDRTFRSVDLHQLCRVMHVTEIKYVEAETGDEWMDGWGLFDDVMVRVLSLGLNFAVAPRKIPYRDIIVANESTARQLDNERA